ncbi:MAG TPA: ABC transporter permease [Puia sp.]|nr:ABC transporter permease [Puia sp.]
MLKNYFSVVWRILLRQKVFSAINIAGLALGMAACLLIVQYISFELSYDNFHVHRDDVYRIHHQTYRDGALAESLPTTYAAVGPVLKSAFPEVIRETRVDLGDGMVSTLRPDGSFAAFNESSIYFVDSSFLHVFSFPLVQGTAAALDKPNSAVITEDAARKYFPGQDPIGKTFAIQAQTSGTDVTATVTGVCKNVPANSHLQFSFLVSSDFGKGDWVTPQFYTYIQLAPSTLPKAFQTKMSAYLKSNIEVLAQNNSSSNTQGKTNLSGLSLTLQPLRDIHLYSNLPQELTPGVDGGLVWSLGIIALLILVIAYINYLNLTTAKVIERAKEVGIRKVLGSQRAQLIRQFLFESLFFNTLSLVAAIAIAGLSMPWFSRLCGVEMDFTIWKSPFFMPAFVALLLTGVLLSALYPALVLSAYKPVQILKGSFQNTGKGLWLRKALVVFQFTATVALMAGTLIVYRQVNYMVTANKGMDMKQTLIVVAPKNIRATNEDNAVYARKDTLFRAEVMRNPGVQSITTSSSIPGQNIGFILSYTSRVNGVAKTLRLPNMEMGSGFISQLKLQILAGDSIPSDAYIRRNPILLLNEAAAAALGFPSPQEAVGKFIENKNGRGRVFQNEIVGVTKNFHQSSLKNPFTPIVFHLSDPNSTEDFEVKVNSANLPQTIAAIEKTYKSVYPASAFEYFFLDDYFNRQYQTEQHFGQVFSLFAGFAIFVACIGLFGLTLLTINQRVKEIGIRKVLGASVPNILRLIVKDFAVLIVIANLIALPLAYAGGYKWLQGYSFRTSLSWWLFALPLVSVFAIAFLTISHQVIKAALANPVKSLRTE